MHPLAEKLATLPPPSPVVSPDLEGGYFVRPQSGADLEAWESELSSRRNDKTDTIDTAGLRAKLIRIAVCDGDGVSIFADMTVEQINAIPAAKLHALYEAVKVAWGLIPKDEADSKN